MANGKRIFGIPVEQLDNETLKQMMETTKGHGASSFVINEKTREVSKVDGPEHFFVTAFSIESLLGSTIYQAVEPEYTRRERGRSTIESLYSKLGIEVTSQSIDEAWQKAEAHRKQMETHQTAPHTVHSTNGTTLPNRMNIPQSRHNGAAAMTHP